jgi:hypothetical protein
MRVQTADAPMTVRVRPNGRGEWEVGLNDGLDRVTCGTLNEARQVAYRCAAGRPSCELIVYDAYHRVHHRELIDREGGRPAAVRRTGE